MTLQQFIYAVTIAEEHSVNKASQKLFLSQSSLSASIQNLEQEIGLTLFNRTNRGVTVTPEGDEFLVYARQIVDQYRLTEEKFVLKKESKKNFSVSAQHYSFAVEAFIQTVRQFQMDEYSLGFYECTTAEIIENVRRYKSEIGVIYKDDFNGAVLDKMLNEQSLTFTPLFDCKVYVFLANSHPLAKRKKIALEELESYPMLSFDQGENQNFYLAEEVYSNLNYPQVIKGSDRATFLNLMVGLNAYTLCSGILCEDLNGDGYQAIPLKSDKVMHVGYIMRKDSKLSPMGQVYIEELAKSKDAVLQA